MTAMEKSVRQRKFINAETNGRAVLAVWSNNGRRASCAGRWGSEPACLPSGRRRRWRIPTHFVGLHPFAKRLDEPLPAHRLGTGRRS